MKKLIGLITVFSIFTLLLSCVGKRKIAKMNNALSSQKQSEILMQQKLNTLDSTRDIKEKKGELDNQSSSSIKKILNSEMASSKERTDSINTMASHLKRGMKLRNYKNTVTFNLAGQNIISEKKENVDFMDDLLKQQSFAKFNTATFFSTGGFAIPDDKIKTAKEVFSPILDSLIVFEKKYPTRKLSSSVVCYGYADEQPFKDHTELWYTLTKNLNDTNASRQTLNVELSRLRSENVSAVLQSLLREKAALFPEASEAQIQFVKIGKGEEYPNKTITDYAPADERRRIVVVFWNALPKDAVNP